MKKNKFQLLFIVLIIILAPFTLRAQTSPKTVMAPGISNPWTDDELIEPLVLAEQIKTKAPLVFNIGAVEDIKGAKHIGAASNSDNVESLKKAVAALPKSTPIVIYCGCCPFAKCPNIRPAFTALKNLGFMNVKLLNLATNLKTNWMAKGYPLAN